MQTIPRNYVQDELGLLIHGFFAEERKAESRFFTSNVERAVQRNGDNCPECEANEDPDAIPLHPRCDCEAITTQIQTGVPPEEVASAINVEAIVFMSESNSPVGVRLDPLSASSVSTNSLRFGDMTRWLAGAPLTDWDFVAVVPEGSGEDSRVLMTMAGNFEGEGVVKAMYLIPTAEVTIDKFKTIFDEIRKEANDAKDSVGTSNDDGGSGSEI